MTGAGIVGLGGVAGRRGAALDPAEALAGLFRKRFRPAAPRPVQSVRGLWVRGTLVNDVAEPQLDVPGKLEDAPLNAGELDLSSWGDPASHWNVPNGY